MLARVCYVLIMLINLDFKASLLDEFRYFNPDVVKLLE